MVTIVLIVIAVLIIAYLLGLGNAFHIHASIHIAHLKPILLVVLVLVLLALVLRR